MDAYPRLYQSQEHNRLFSDYWKEDASYLRLKNIQIGYRFPARMVAPLGINSLRVYASADNLFTKTDYFGAYDPEVRTTSGDVYPQVNLLNDYKDEILKILFNHCFLWYSYFM